MPEYDSLYQQLNIISGKLGNLEGKMDSLLDVFKKHEEDDQKLEGRVRTIEQTQVKHSVYVALAAAVLAFLASKITSILKFTGTLF